MADTIGLDELVVRFRKERAVRGTPHLSAASVIAGARGRLDDATMDVLVFGGRSILEQKGIPPEVHLSPPLAAAIASGTRYFLTRSAILARERRADARTGDDAALGRRDDERGPIALITWDSDAPGRKVSRMAVPDSDLMALMAVDLVELERIRALREGLDAGTLSPRVLTVDEYRDFYGLNDAGWGQIFLMVGWLPSLLVASLAGIVVAVVTWDWWRCVVVAVSGTILGILATVPAWTAFAHVDARWLRLGDHSETALAVVLFGTGPAVALLIALLVTIHA
ncbi:MAG: hypothetical protein R6W93_07370 [Candidatus Limnocylindrales bacterium]